jgi:enhancing lycopene biosynthesis protein 2
VVDRERKIITSPAYMLAERISEAADGIERTVEALLEMA